MAVVNGEAITNIDVENRLAYLLSATGLKLTDDNEAQLRDDVLNMLIDDKLKFIEVKRLAPGLIEAGHSKRVKWWTTLIRQIPSHQAKICAN